MIPDPNLWDQILDPDAEINPHVCFPYYRTK